MILRTILDLPRRLYGKVLYHCLVWNLYVETMERSTADLVDQLALWEDANGGSSACNQDILERLEYELLGTRLIPLNHNEELPFIKMFISFQRSSK